jgi:thioredoxin 1
MIDEPIHVTDSAFEKTVLNSPIPVIVDFWAPWCNPCKMIAPTLEKIAKENAGKVIVAKVNTDENPEWAMKYGVQGIPTMLFISGGKIVHRQVGAIPEPVLRTIVIQFLEVIGQDSKN